MSIWKSWARTGVIYCTTAMVLAGGRLMAAPQQSEHDQEAREAEQERKQKEQERLDRMQELYDEGRDALDEEHYREAEQRFSDLAQMNGPQTDAALYWKAYAQNREGKKDAALESIAPPLDFISVQTRCTPAARSSESRLPTYDASRGFR